MPTTSGNVWYVDPLNGSDQGDGSAANPWRTLEEVAAAKLIRSFYATGQVRNPSGRILPGDTILLYSGYHGDFDLSQYYNDKFITIAAAPGQNPIVSSIQITNGARWRFQGLTVTGGGRLIYLYSPDTGGDFEVLNSKIFTITDASGWSKSDWERLAKTGIVISASNVRVIGNSITNVSSGVTLAGNDIEISNNSIDRFTNDGVSGGGSRIRIAQNYIANVIRAVTGTHNDAIQIHRGSNPCNCNDITIAGNFIIQNTDPSIPFNGTLQGITDFSSPNSNWLVENNVVLVDHNHGISIEGLSNSVVRHNTVYRFDPASGFSTPIKIYNDPNGVYPSFGNIVTNNLATTISVSSTSNVVTCNDSLAAKNPFLYFADFNKFDVSLKSGSPAINAGCPGDLATDIVGHPRDSQPDLGAYEYSP